MTEDVTREPECWTASSYYVTVQVECPLDSAWEHLINYRAWNPSFQDAVVEHLGGTTNAAGGRVLIRKTAEFMDSQRVPDFYADTLILDSNRHQVVWYVSPTVGRMFRNFVDFRLALLSEKRVQFEISYYEQNQLTGAALDSHRIAYEADLKDLANAFRSHCEGIHAITIAQVE